MLFSRLSRVFPFLVLILVSMFFFCTCQVFAGQIYKWRDEQGRIHFSDTPRDENSQVVKKTAPRPVAKPATEKKPDNKAAESKPEAEKAEPAPDIEIPYTSKERYADRIIVKIKLNGFVTASMMVDTGAPGLIITEDLAHRLRLFDKDGSQLLAFISGIGGSQYATRTIIDSVTIQNITVEDVPAHIVSDMSDAYDGLIGMDILSGYMLTIDPVNEKLIARKIPESPDRPGGYRKTWWQGLFREFREYKEYWNYHADQVEKVGSVYDRMLPKKREMYKEFIFHQRDEADHLYRKLIYKARRYHVPKHWRKG